MAKVAYCGGCGRRVALTESGECPNGHLRSMLRDIREEAAPPEPAAPARAETLAPAEDRDDLAAVVIGKAVVIVPIAAFVAFALWTGYLQVVGSGGSPRMAVLISIGSLILTVGGAFVWAAMRRRNR